MHYRKYGNSEQIVSEIGMGGHREGVEAGEGPARNARFFLSAQQRARVVGHAIDRGITYFDTTFGCEIVSLAESLRLLHRRDGLFISGMRVDFFANLLIDPLPVRNYTRREVEARLQESGLEVLDQFMLGALEFGDPLNHPRGGELYEALDELDKMREEGKFRFIGFSTHTPDYAAQLLEAYPAFDAVMVPYNFANRATEGALMDALNQHSAAWIAMKTHVWHIYGIPVTVLRHLQPVKGNVELDSTVPIGKLALQFVLQNPRITTCVPAMNTVAAVDENTAASGVETLDSAGIAALEAYAGAMLAEDLMPLAIGGLLEDNMRVQSHAINLIHQKLELPAPDFDLTAADAEHQVKTEAAGCLELVRTLPRWAPYID
ncbi:MAG: aldo/keto reductase [Anaerolineae bacterium]|nr:aldo/keto reductase [Anaerolineae bacterium]